MATRDGHTFRLEASESFRAWRLVPMPDNNDYSRPHASPRLPAPPPPPNRPRMTQPPKPSNIFFNPNFRFPSILKRTTLPVVKKTVPMQHCATVLIPIFLTMITVFVCLIVGLAFLTDGYSYCGDKEKTTQNEDSTCLSKDCIVHSGKLLSSLDEMADPCHNFFQYSCGHKKNDKREISSFEKKLKEKLEEKPRPSFPLPQRLLFDFYDSCMNEEHQNQLASHPSLVSKIGGWHLLQNAKFDNESAQFEKLEVNLHNYGIETLIVVKDDIISAPEFMQETFKEQNLHEFFLNVLTEMDVDIDLAQTAVEKALRLEAELIKAKKKGLSVKMKIKTLELDYPEVDWKVFFDSDDKILGLKRSIHANPSYLKKINQLKEDYETTINYQMIRFLFSLTPALPRKYRRHLKDLNDEIIPRWKKCINEIKQMLAVPLLKFSKKMIKSNVEDTVNIERLKLNVAHKLKSVDWIDLESKENLNDLLETLKITGFDSLNWDKIKEIYKKERLDPTSYFENVIILRQINAQVLESEKWSSLLSRGEVIFHADPPEIVLGPLTVMKMESMNRLHKEVSLTAEIYKVLFDQEAIKRLTKESQSILNAKTECFKNKSTHPVELFYTICAFETIKPESGKSVNLPGLGEFSTQKLFFLDYSTSECLEAQQR
uniref:Peptidase_M13_N domain-containing protein n=1 Tax=Bursaphelenchus xylophilus TaxID=6326 RepID=A0A1I7RNT9_BURXY